MAALSAHTAIKVVAAQLCRERINNICVRAKPVRFILKRFTSLCVYSVTKSVRFITDSYYYLFLVYFITIY